MKNSRKKEILSKLYDAACLGTDDVINFESKLVKEARKEMEMTLATYKKKINKVELNSELTRKKIFLALELS